MAWFASAYLKAEDELLLTEGERLEEGLVVVVEDLGHEVLRVVERQLHRVGDLSFEVIRTHQEFLEVSPNSELE